MKANVVITGHSIGVDISKNKFDCAYLIQKSDKKLTVKASKSFDNNAKGFKEFLLWIEAKRSIDAVLHILMEATGCYHENLLEFLADSAKNINLILVQGNMAKNYARSLGYYSKTDKIDAKMLGQLALERQHRSWKSTPKNVRIIRDLLRQRVKLLNIKTQITNQIHAYSYSATKGEVNMKVYEDLLISLGEQIKVIAQAVKKEVELDKLLKANVALLESIPGVGFDTAVSILVETNQFINFTSGSKLISYAGYDILQRQSGTHVGKTKISKKGNKYIRRQLYCPAQSHVNRKGVFITLYQRLIDNGKKKLQASVAVQMRLLKLMFSLVKFGKTYNANYQHHTIQNGTPLAM